MRLLVLISLIASLRAATPTNEQLARAADAYLKKEPVTGMAFGFSLEEGYEAQRKYVGLLEPKLGKVAGYKIGVITKAGQERLGAKGPARGTLLRKMLLKDNAKVSPKQGARPALEIDMGVTVKDEGINNATSVEEAIAHLADFVCFIELVDSLTPTNQPTDIALVAALNVGARAGVLGEKRKMTRELAAALPSMKLSLIDDAGKVIAEVPALGLQPLDNLPWLISELKKDGRGLKKGDFISLGSPAAPQPIRAGEAVTLLYENIPGGPMRARVRFAEK